jgi:hypothetical protein
MFWIWRAKKSACSMLRIRKRSAAVPNWLVSRLRGPVRRERRPELQNDTNDFCLQYLRSGIDKNLRTLHEGRVRQSSLRPMRAMQRLLQLRSPAG